MIHIVWQGHPMARYVIDVRCFSNTCCLKEQVLARHGIPRFTRLAVVLKMPDGKYDVLLFGNPASLYIWDYPEDVYGNGGYDPPRCTAGYLWMPADRITPETERAIRRDWERAKAQIRRFRGD